jgi:microcystin-dependent protein
MALRQRNFFFDPTNTDRFNSQDIPTEQTMSDWCDSVPFIKEPTDRAQLTRSGIAKTTSDAKINTGDNTDAAGVSPLGFTTFVRPAQIPKILDSSSVTWAKVPRGGATTTDTGVGIEDWQASVNFPIPEDQDADQITTTAELELTEFVGTVCGDLSTISSILPSGTELQVVLNQLQDSIRSITDRFTAVAARACEAEQRQVALGDIILSYAPPSTWTNNWLMPSGQLLTVSAYPLLYAIFGNLYGGVPGVSFNLPDLASNKNYLRAISGNGLISPSNVDGGLQNYTIMQNDLPAHNHTYSTTATGGEHFHTYQASNSVTEDGCSNSFRMGSNADYSQCVDGNALKTSPDFGPTGGHTHSISGTTNNNVTNNDPIWDMSIAEDKTPAYTNFYLKMRVK